MSEPRVVETVDPDEAFAVLSDGTRIDVLRALWDADGDELSFSALRHEVGVADSGKFNYHLGKLTDRFVEKGEDGYRLRAAGMQVVGALLAGAYTMEGSVESATLDEACPTCGGVMTFRYETERVRIDCGDCEFEVRFVVPPAVFADAKDEPVTRTTDRYLRTTLHRVKHGICPYCEGRTEPRVLPPEEHGDGNAQPSPVVAHDCSRCGISIVSDLGWALFDHPAVVSFFYERGVDVREAPIWRFSAFDGDRSRLLQRDPLRVVVTFSADGNDLTITTDRSLDVLAVDGPAD